MTNNHTLHHFSHILVPLFTKRWNIWSQDLAKSRCHETVFIIIVSLWNLTGVLVKVLPSMSYFLKAIRSLQTYISWLRDFVRSCDKTLHRLMHWTQVRPWITQVYHRRYHRHRVSQAHPHQAIRNIRPPEARSRHTGPHGSRQMGRVLLILQAAKRHVTQIRTTEIRC